MRSFTARAVAAEELPDLETFAVVFAENVDGSGQRLELQRSLPPNEDEEDEDMQTYCVCTEDGACCYGGVTGWSLDGARFELRLDERAARVFGADGFVVTLEEDPAVANDPALRAGLARVFADARYA